MQSSHAASVVAVAFDETNLIADAGLVSVVRLAERAGLPELTEHAVRITGAGNSGGACPGAKVMSLVAVNRNFSVGSYFDGYSGGSANCSGDTRGRHRLRSVPPFVVTRLRR